MAVTFTLFETAMGFCGLVWQKKFVRGVQLPEVTVAATRERLKDRFPMAIEHKPTGQMQRVIGQLSAVLGGQVVDLSAVLLDMTDVPPFHQRVYAVVKQIPYGKIQTYKQIAEKVGSPSASRAVGQAMARNPFPLIVPCHRVTAAGGKLGGFTANGGVETKRYLLEKEGVALDAPSVNHWGRLDHGQVPLKVRNAMMHLCAVDTQIATLIEQIGTFQLTLSHTQDVFTALAEAIVYQQLHGKAAATIFKRLCNLFPDSGELFTPQDIGRCGDEDLRSAGLSSNKLLALRDLAYKTLDGTLPSLDELRALDDESIIQRLTAVRGIGRWTVEMLLIFRLGRPDVLPVDDYGIRKGFMLAFNKSAMPTPKELHTYGQRWSPYRSVVSWYLWRAADRAKASKN